MNMNIDYKVIGNRIKRRERIKLVVIIVGFAQFACAIVFALGLSVHSFYLLLHKTDPFDSAWRGDAVTAQVVALLSLVILKIATLICR